MMTNQQPENPSDPQKSPQNRLPSWENKFLLKSFKKGVSYSAGVVLDHYLIVSAQDKSLSPLEKDEHYDEKDDQLACLLAFDLVKRTVQEAWINMNFFKHQKDYSFLKYGENQIIKYGGDCMPEAPASLCCITVKSFEPFVVQLEGIKNLHTRRFSQHTAQIYKDHLYIYGRTGKERTELWSFDLKNHSWELCETTGESPGETMAHSFILQDSLCIYGGVTYENRFSGDLFVLHLNSMNWTKIQQPENFLCSVGEYFGLKSGGTIYKDSFITLKNGIYSRENTLCFLDLHTQNTWTTFDIKGINEDYMPSEVVSGDLMTYENFLLALFCTEQDDQNLRVAIMDLSDGRSQKNGKKRMEPSENSVSEEGSILKKTKGLGPDETLGKEVENKF